MINIIQLHVGFYDFCHKSETQDKPIYSEKNRPSVQLTSVNTTLSRTQK